MVNKYLTKINLKKSLGSGIVEQFYSVQHVSMRIIS
jgi:hypothetical protein